MSSAGRHDSAHRSSRLSTAAGPSWGSVVMVLARIPCLQAFMLTALFPRSDLGPVDRLAFLRLIMLLSSGDSFIAVRLRGRSRGSFAGRRPALPLDTIANRTAIAPGFSAPGRISALVRSG